jgi:hypothetical protein
MKLEPHGIRCKLHAGEPRPFERILALLDVLLGGASTVVEPQDPLVRQAAVGDDEADGREQFAR